MAQIIKLIQYIVDGIELAKKLYADHRDRKANEQARKGDQRELEKTLGDSGGPSNTPGVLERERRKRD